MRQRRAYFYSEGCKLDGVLYLPDTIKEGDKRPCIIPNSGYLGLNAIYPRLFAKHFTQQGYVALGFDYRGFGESEGLPGYCLLDNEVVDIKNALTFAALQREVDPNRMVLLGWGMGAALVTKVAAEDDRAKACALLNGFYNGERWMKSIHSEDDWRRLTRLMDEDRVGRVLTGQSTLDDPYLFYPLDPDTRTVVEQALVPVKGFAPPIAHALGESIRSFNAEEFVSKIAPRPVFIAHGKHNALHPIDEAYSIFEKAREPKTLHLIEGKHNDFMFDDHPEFQRLVAKLATFFDSAFRDSSATLGAALG